MRRLAEQVARGVQLLGRAEFEKQRQEVRQLVGLHRHAAFFIQRLQIDHRLAAIPALAMDMFEDVERKSARASEQQLIAFLEIVEVALRQFIEERVESFSMRPGAEAFPVERVAYMWDGGQHILLRIRQKRRQNLEGEDGGPSFHHTISIGLLALLG